MRKRFNNGDVVVLANTDYGDASSFANCFGYSRGDEIGLVGVVVDRGERDPNRYRCKMLDLDTEKERGWWFDSECLALLDSMFNREEAPKRERGSM